MIDLRRFLRLLDVVLADGPSRAPEAFVASVTGAVRETPRRPVAIGYARRALTELAFAGAAIAVLAGAVTLSR